jgi:hypothetical protein
VFIGYLTPVWSFDAQELTTKAVSLSGYFFRIKTTKQVLNTM